MSLFLVGGTGALGQKVAKGLRTAQGFAGYKALVRSASADSDKAKALADMGWTIVPVDDFSDSIALEQALSGAKVVVSTVGGGQMVETEKSVIDAARKAGASLFVPSQFGVDGKRWGTRFPFLAGKEAVLDYAAEQDLPTLRVLCGMFSDFIHGFLADVPNMKARVVGTEDSAEKLSFTLRSDIGYVLAKALEDPESYKGGSLAMHGSCMTWAESLTLIEKINGKKFDIEYLSGEAALKQEEELLKKGLEGDMGAFYGAFALHLLGEPGRGNDGADMTAEAKNYGVKLEPLEVTLQKLYGSA